MLKIEAEERADECTMAVDVNLDDVMVAAAAVAVEETLLDNCTCVLVLGREKGTVDWLFDPASDVDRASVFDPVRTRDWLGVTDELRTEEADSMLEVTALDLCKADEVARVSIAEDDASALEAASFELKPCDLTVWLVFAASDVTGPLLVDNVVALAGKANVLLVTAEEEVATLDVAEGAELATSTEDELFALEVDVAAVTDLLVELELLIVELELVLVLCTRFHGKMESYEYRTASSGPY